MKGLPQRQSLVIQTTEYLREALERGEWQDFLPGHRVLCEHLQVSRYTLHMALHVLKNEGLIRIAQGKRIRIVNRRRVPARREPSRVVVALMTRSLEDMETNAHYYIAKLQHYLQISGFELQLHIDPRLLYQNLPRSLETLVGQRSTACWLLSSVNPFIQRWFMDRGLPTFISGTPDGQIHLPAMALDTAAICRDAVKRFLDQGHRRLALLTFKSEVVGDQIGDQEFLERIGELADSRVRVDVFSHDRTVSGICRAVDSVMASPHGITGIFSANARHSLTVVSHLIQRGVRMPLDVSVISRDFAPFLSNLVPCISGYRETQQKLAAESFAKQVATLARSGVLPCKTTWIDWKFVAGDTFGPASSRD